MTVIEPTKPTIVFVSISPSLGGSNRSLTTLMSEIGDRAHRVLAAPSGGRVFSFASSRNAVDEILLLPYRHGRASRFASSFTLARWLWERRSSVTIVHAQALTGLNIAVPGAALARLPVLVRVSDAEPSTWGRRLGPFLRMSVPELRVVPVSEDALAIAVRNGICTEDEAVVIPNPVDFSDVRGRRLAKPGERSLSVGFLGNATERKGWDILLDVAKSTLDLDLVWKIFVPDQNSEIRERLNRDFPPGRMVLVGRVRDVRTAYEECDIVFVPSRAESFGRVVAEAMVNELAIVASDLPPIRDMVADEAGVLFPPGDAVSAANALRRMATDSELRARSSAAGSVLAQRFDPAVIMSRLAPLYGIEES